MMIDPIFEKIGVHPSPNYVIPELFRTRGCLTMRMDGRLSENGMGDPDQAVFDRIGKAKESYSSIGDYVVAHVGVLLADLTLEKYTQEEIETAVNERKICVAPWPRHDAETHFYWTTEFEPFKKLAFLASEAAKHCYGEENEPAFGTVTSVGFHVGDQGTALGGLIIAREFGLVKELPPDLSADIASRYGTDGFGPIYIRTDSFTHRMFKKFGIIGD
jgi:hypothetical protein